MRFVFACTSLLLLVLHFPTALLRAGGTELIVVVSEAGMQRLSGAELVAAGLDPAGDPARLWLQQRGQVVPLELSGHGGRIDQLAELRFYAPPPGDRWNQADYYRLSLAAMPGPRMAMMPAQTGVVAERAEALERGLIYTPRLYDSRRPGPDGDRWFSADLRAEAASPDEVLVQLEPALPPAAGATSLTVSAQTYAGANLQLKLSLEAHASGTLWPTPGTWTDQISLNGPGEKLRLTLHTSAAMAGLLLDRIAWERPARLELGGRGASFSGIAGLWRYRLSGLPADWTLYDVTDPANPARLSPDGASFIGGPAPRDYLVAGPGTLHRPDVRLRNPGAITAPLRIDALYIAPEAWHATLTPLLAQRERQGQRVAAIALESIYDHWSDGAVDPEAIRSFVAQAAAWPTPPHSIVLVGDGSSDPHDWTARGPNNLNIIPPYLAVVDPWLGEASCDTCYARISSSDPRADPLPALAVGRLPVKRVTELAALITRLIAYDEAPEGERWRTTVALIADDTDTAGDFAAESRRIAAALPGYMRTRQVFFDPSGVYGYASAVTARDQTMAAFNDGAGMVIYHGHSHPWQWAITDLDSEYSWLLGLYDPDRLTNAERLPIVLAMTCLSSNFARPAESGTTIDERLLLVSGGAVAVWGPAGMGVAYGHDRLLSGFLHALWAAPPGTATLGTLTQAGLRELHAGGGSNSTLYTYVLLGDPLTRARVFGDYETLLPLVAK
jgi:hypothetical protein